jgi:GH15 family glucan-1,4-alpha-glucosidase
MSEDGVRISDYAVIGDCRAAALVSKAGSVDWLCWPRFDSSSLFAALLDRRRGGRFAVTPAAPYRTRRRYLDESNVLETTFELGGEGASLVLTDLMPVFDEEAVGAALTPDHELLRIVEARGGDVPVEITFDPRPHWGTSRFGVRADRWGDLRVEADRGLLILRSDARTGMTPGRQTLLTLRAGERVALSLTYTQEAPAVLPTFGPRTAAVLDETVRCWRRWIAPNRYEGPYRGQVRRSALAVKLLCYAPSGAVVAAPTTSLPERVGGDLNWDYRFCWLRDASLTVRALLALGHDQKAVEFVSWLLHTTRLTRPRVRVLYDVFGVPPPREHVLDHLEGFRGSRPVRVGNAADEQDQLDVYGEVLEAALALGLAEPGARVDRETRSMLLSFGRYVAEHWQEPDAGIWEVRGRRRRHTTALALGAVALARVAALARGPAERERLEETARQMRETIETRAWDEAKGSYVDALEGGTLDASLFLLPIYGYTDATAPRMRATCARLLAELRAGPALLYRNVSGLLPPEGAFGICSFWAVEAMARGAASLEEAREAFEQMLGYANDVGLYSEEIEPTSGEALGNFPQGFTHVGLINAALALEARSARERGARPPATVAPRGPGATRRELRL